MIKVTSSSSGVRTQRVVGWVSVIWFTSAVSVTASQVLELQTPQEHTARCGENVTLKCEATSSKDLDVKEFIWLYQKSNVCLYKNNQSDPELLCKRDPNTRHDSLTLTLINVMPLRQGQYICKIRASQGAKSSKSAVTVQDCLGSSDSFITKSHATCRFSGVYPKGVIHWFQDHVNLTGSASTKEEEDQHGRYNVSSTIDVQEGQLNASYTCTLWIPSLSKELSSQELYHENKRSESSGNMVTLILVLVLGSLFW